MKKLGLLMLAGTFVLSGCVVRTYPLTKERVDQDLNTGNRGYLAGTAPQPSTERKTERTTQIVEIEVRSPIKFEKAPKKVAQEPAAVTPTADDELYGNRGYVTQSETAQIAEPAVMEKYTVQKGDTLQKISQKLFGTTKNWHKIYKANADTLKAPDRIRPGQVINIPACPKVEQPKENTVNLK